MTTLLSIIRTFSFLFYFSLLSHSSCLSWIFCRQSRGMVSSPSRERFLMRLSQVSGEHWMQMTPKRSTIWFILTRQSQNCRQMECSASSRMVMSRMMLAKMQRSERRDLSEIRIPLPVIWLYSVHLVMRLMKAQIWKVKPHRSGLSQYSPRRLMFFFSPTFCHSVRGSSRMESSGKFSLMIFKMVDFPLPILPSIEIKRGCESVIFWRHSPILNQQLNLIQQQKFNVQISIYFQKCFSSNAGLVIQGFCIGRFLYGLN